jgi:mxaL protein
MLYVLSKPIERQPLAIYKLLVVVDITRSMNAMDYTLDGQRISRLDYIKQSLVALAGALPCQSKLGLGVFTERRATLLFEPIEVCSGYTEIAATLKNLDWRMAWAADSRIASGLHKTLDMLPKSDAALVFITDGQEAPPVNPKYQIDFAGVKNKHKGIVIGAGDLALVPIPKFNNKGVAVGNYQPDDVPQRSTFGESDLNPEAIKGYDARNAPFGSEAVTGNEHLASLHEAYLQQLSAAAGLQYHRLTDVDGLLKSLQQPAFAITKTLAVDVRWKPAILALVAVLLIYLPFRQLALALKPRSWARKR